MAIKLSSVVAPLVFVALLIMVSPAQAGFSFHFGHGFHGHGFHGGHFGGRFGFGFRGYPFYIGISATVSMGFITEDFIEDSITRTDSDMGSAGIMGSVGITGSVAATETRRG